MGIYKYSGPDTRYIEFMLPVGQAVNAKNVRVRIEAGSEDPAYRNKLEFTEQDLVNEVVNPIYDLLYSLGYIDSPYYSNIYPTSETVSTYVRE